MQHTIKQAEVDIKLDQGYRNKLEAAERLIEQSVKAAAKKKSDKVAAKKEKANKALLAELDEAIKEIS
jgi:hypothetical protein